MQHINYEVLGKKLIERYPTVAKELIQLPALQDLKLLPAIQELIYSNIRILPKSKTIKKEYLVSILLTLYDPDCLAGYKKMRKGLRKAISELLNCDPSLISHNIKKVNIYIAVYEEFADNTRYLADIIKERYGGNTIRQQ